METSDAYRGQAASASEPDAGGHRLPVVFSSPSTARTSRRRRPGLVYGVLGVLAAGAILGCLQIFAHVAYDAAEQKLETAVDEAEATQAAAGAAAANLERATEDARVILDGDSGLLVDPALNGALADALSDGESISAAAAPVLDDPLPSAGSKPGWFWELFGEAGRLEQLRQDAAELQEKFEQAQPELETAVDETTESALSAITSAYAAATPFESAHVSARNLEVIALRDAAAQASSVTTLDPSAAGAFVALDDAAEAVVASEQAELAEKAGPLQGVRLEVEAFARSLAPGVLLEFDWAPLVNGYGADGSMGGYTTWWYDDPGYSTLLLSDSVAEQWPSERSKALVAHEVGHAISVKCEGMYDDSTSDSIEKWATAWAISMGFTDDANGVWAYGYPPQSYIDAAAGCR